VHAVAIEVFVGLVLAAGFVLGLLFAPWRKTVLLLGLAASVAYGAYIAASPEEGDFPKWFVLLFLAVLVLLWGVTVLIGSYLRRRAVPPSD
jgi:drug/metabolite transporter (DMT)-like permease